MRLPVLLLLLWACSRVSGLSWRDVLQRPDTNRRLLQTQTQQTLVNSNGNSTAAAHAIQRIRATASAEDLSGGFAVHYMGESSDLIPVDATADQMKAALEGMALATSGTGTGSSIAIGRIGTSGTGTGIVVIVATSMVLKQGGVQAGMRAHSGVTGLGYALAKGGEADDGGV